MINDIIKRLRKAADVLEELLDFNPASNIKAVKKIHKAIEKVNKKRRYNGKHWTQQPKNKAKLMRVVNHMKKAKGGK